MHPTVESMRVAATLGEPLVFLCPNRKYSFDRVKSDALRRLTNCDGTVLLMIDGVRGGDLMSQLKARNCDVRSLFPDDTDEELQAVAPCAVEVTPDVIAELFETFWGLGIASFVCGRSDADALHNHIANHIYAEAADGEVCLLRLQDPRTLMRLADTFTAEQTKELMGPDIDCFLFEDSKGSMLVWGRPARTNA